MSFEISVREVGQQIYFIRGHRVMLDSDLARLYEVKVKALNQAVRRNIERFPEDFSFELSQEEAESLRSQIVTLETGRGQHRKYRPRVFTEQGVSMLSSVLRSRRAIQVNVTIMRTFVKLREMLETNKELAKKLDQLERKYDHQFKVVFDAIRKLMADGSPLVTKRIKGLARG
jgi:aromatic ring-opening dioxygenase LigB subunit